MSRQTTPPSIPPGAAAPPLVESNFLSVRHGPWGHQQSMKTRKLQVAAPWQGSYNTLAFSEQ